MHPQGTALLVIGFVAREVLHRWLGLGLFAITLGKVLLYDTARLDAAYLVAKAIQTTKVVGFADLGMEAIYEFEVKDMPVTVAVDSEGNNVHTLAPLHWQRKIAEEGLLKA